MKIIILILFSVLLVQKAYATSLCKDLGQLADDFNVQLGKVLAKPSAINTLTLRGSKTVNSRVDRVLTIKTQDLNNDGLNEKFVEYIRPLRGRKYSKYLYILDSKEWNDSTLQSYLEGNGFSKGKGLAINDVLEFPVDLSSLGIKKTDLKWEEVWMELVTFKNNNYVMVRTSLKAGFKYKLIEFSNGKASIVCDVLKSKV